MNIVPNKKEEKPYTEQFQCLFRKFLMDFKLPSEDTAHYQYLIQDILESKTKTLHIDYVSLSRSFYSDLFNLKYLFNKIGATKKITINKLTLGVQNATQCKQLIKIKSELSNAINTDNGVNSKLNSLFGHRLRKDDLIFIAEITSKDLKIKIEKENKRTKKDLLEWFQKNWEEISGYLIDLAKANFFNKI